MIDTCIYCEKITYVMPWQETQELVCYDCRIDLLDTEFEPATELEKDNRKTEAYLRYFYKGI